MFPSEKRPGGGGDDDVGAKLKVRGCHPCKNLAAERALFANTLAPTFAQTHRSHGACHDQTSQSEQSPAIHARKV